MSGDYQQNEDGTWSEAEPCKSSIESSKSSAWYYMAKAIIGTAYISAIVFASIYFKCPKILWALIGLILI